MALFPGVPTGSCNARQLALNQANATLYTCNNGAWQLISGGGGGGAGTVTTFASNNLGPLFTTSVSTPSTTPILNFAFQPTSGDTIFGNNSVATGSPTFFTPGGDVSFSSGSFSVNALHFGPTAVSLQNTGIASGNCLTVSGSTIVGGPCGSSGGSTLAGCSTPTAGNLLCTNSVAAGSGNQGILSLAYSNLPAPASTALAQLAVNNTGAPFWTPGTSVAYSPIMLGNAANGLLPGTSIDTSRNSGGLGNTVVLRSDFNNCNWAGWSSATQLPTCADLRLNSQPLASYTLTPGDENMVVLNTLAGAVTNTLPVPTGAFAFPFVAWIDTKCASTVTLQAASGALINSASSARIGACGWAMLWTDGNGVDWHGQIYDPPGGVEIVE